MITLLKLVVKYGNMKLLEWDFWDKGGIEMFVNNNKYDSIVHMCVRSASCECPIARIEDGFPLRP